MKRKFRLINLLFLILLGTLFFYFWYWRKNVYSKEVLRLEILGPEEVDFGKEVEYIVKYKNNGNFRLEEPELIFEPPESSLKDGEPAKREILKEDKLGPAIYPGEENSFSFKMRIFGKEGEAKIARASLSFRPKNLKARYTSNSSLTTKIKAIPLTFEFDLPSKIEAGKRFNLHIDYFSNVDYLLKNLRVQVDYPTEFEFLESKPKAIEQSEWEIPVLNKTDGGRIEISGKLTGEVGTAVVFRGRLGILIADKFVSLKEIEKGVEITKPLIFLRQEINGNPQYVAMPGEWLHYTIYFKNIGDEELQNLFLIAKLEGDAFDFQTIKSEIGETKPGDDSIVFDWRKVAKLQYLVPRDEGKVEFWVKLKDDLGNVKNPVLKNKVFISQVKEEFVTKISSKVEVFQKGYYQDEVFGNTGPIPPQVGKTTTYTIIWQVKNYYSDIKNVKIKAKLPPYVSFAGKIFPEDMASKFSFDPESREIVWSLGDVPRGSGIFNLPLSLAFQVAFTPREEERGKTPEIIGEVKLSGDDVWSEKIIEATSTAITTALPDDSSMNPELGTVQ